MFPQPWFQQNPFFTLPPKKCTLKGTTTANRTQSGHELIATSKCQVACYRFPCATCNTFCTKQQQQQHDVLLLLLYMTSCQGRKLAGCFAVSWVSVRGKMSEKCLPKKSPLPYINEEHILALLLRLPNQSYDSEGSGAYTWSCYTHS